MQRHNKKKHIGFFGESGSGKTTLAVKFLVNSKYDYNFIFDEEEQFSEMLGIPACRTPEEIEAAIPTGWILFCPDKMFPGEPEKALAFWCEFVCEICNKLSGKKSFMLDEAGNFQESNNIPLPLRIVVQCGRRYGVDGVFLGHHPNEFHNKLRRQLTEIICFQTFEDTSDDFLRNRGFNMDELKALQPFKWIGRTKTGYQFSG